MYQVKFNIRLNNTKLIEPLIKSVRKDIIEEGLDEILEKDLEKYKKDTIDTINGKNPFVKPQDKAEQTNFGEEKTVILPKSEEDILKKLTGVDLSQIRTTKDYTSAVESNVVISHDYRLRIRFPIGPYESFNENYDRAIRYFNSALFVFSSGVGPAKYFYNPGIDLSQYVKVVCSRDTGDTFRSRRVFESYKKSNKRLKQNDSELGRYAEWSLKQEGIAKIIDPNSGFMNITDVVNSIKAGNYEEAVNRLKTFNINNNLRQLQSNIEDIKNDKDLTPEMQAYTNIIKLINSMAVQKDIKTDKVIYSVGINDLSISEDDKTYSDLYFEVIRNLSIWIGSNNVEWVNYLSEKIKALISRYEKANINV